MRMIYIRQRVVVSRLPGWTEPFWCHWLLHAVKNARQVSSAPALVFNSCLFFLRRKASTHGELVRIVTTQTLNYR